MAREYSLDFAYDFNDLGFLDAEVIVSVLEISRGRLLIEVVDVIFNHPKISIDKDYLLEISNDQTRAIFSDIESQAIKKWLGDEGWVA